jgi:DNA-binding response OmpR family regulator
MIDYCPCCHQIIVPKLLPTEELGVELSHRHLHYRDKRVRLTAKERQLLASFFEHRALMNETIRALHFGEAESSSIINVYIHKLRAKLREVGAPLALEQWDKSLGRGCKSLGYKLVDVSTVRPAPVQPIPANT